jgi:hypothetical protein
VRPGKVNEPYGASDAAVVPPVGIDRGYLVPLATIVDFDDDDVLAFRQCRTGLELKWCEAALVAPEKFAVQPAAPDPSLLVPPAAE